MDEENKKSKLQLMGSTFVIITGLFVILAMGNSITGGVVGASSLSIMEIIIAIWGVLIIIAGIWMIRKRDFHKSIFD